MEELENEKKHEHVVEDKMQKAYKLAKSLLKDRLQKESEENIEILNTLSETDIIVVTGTYDHIHLVLKSLGIPFISVYQEELLKIDLLPKQTVFVNCASSFPEEAARKLAGFVASGGQLITTDWALKNVLEVAFPGMVEYNNKPTGDEVVRIELLDKEDTVLTGFIDEKADPVWWLEGSSYPIRVLNHDKVKILVQSKELKEKYDEEAVIIRFDHGRGTVYHMISHFYLQRSETRDAKHKFKASEYANMKGASTATMAEWATAESEEIDLDYGTVQSANTSAEFLSRIILKQKKKYKK